jgi:hypothetical protein
MFRINLKRSIATISVIASALAVAGPASASSTATGLKYDTEVTDYLHHLGLFTADAYDNEMGITTQALVARPN